MNVKRYIFAVSMLMVSLYACKNDDDDGFVAVPPRDLAVQQANEDPIIENYLKTHFYEKVQVDLNGNGAFDYEYTVYDTIAGANDMKTSIWDSGLLQTKTVSRDGIDYMLYVLHINDGDELAEERQPTFADSTFVTYRGEVFYDYEDEDGDGIPDVADVDADGDNAPDVDTVGEVMTTRVDSDGDGIQDIADVDTVSSPIDSDGDGIIDEFDPVDNNNPNRRVFDSRVTPVWLDLVGVIEGFKEAMVDFRGATDFAIPDPNGGAVDTDFGNLTVFMPSGLAYFSTPQNGIPAYAPLIFSIQLYGSVLTDHDNDGVPSYLEDIDGDRRLLLDEGDNTDGDASPNYLDTDDDGDGTLTIDEDLEPDSDLNEDRNGDGDFTNDLGDGDPTNDDTDGDTIPNYLDPDDTASRNN